MHAQQTNFSSIFKTSFTFSVVSQHDISILSHVLVTAHINENMPGKLQNAYTYYTLLT